METLWYVIKEFMQVVLHWLRPYQRSQHIEAETK